MSAHLRRVLADLNHDTSSVELAPPARIRARGEAWRRHRITGGAVAAVVAVVVATVFAVAADGDRSTTSPPLVPASPTTSAATDCGRYVIQHAGERLPDTAIACFLNAVAAGRSAYLAETRPTVEGDPIHMRYAADATGAVEVVRDTRQDDFGRREVTRQTCTGPFDYNGHVGFTECSAPVPA
jgi:hypothetical protein